MEFRVGAKLRALRQRHGWRQADLARRAALSQSVVSLIERGRLDRVSIEKIRRVARELDADLVIQVRWRGGDLDRLLDEGHAGIVGAMVEALSRLDWRVRTEVSYSEYGERGSIDILAWHEPTRSLLVLEMKTELTSIEETLRKHDEKVRLAPKIARDQCGWVASATSRLLVLPNLATPRRRVQRQAAVLAAAYPARGRSVRSWLASPIEAIDGLMFIDAGNAKRAISRKRIRCRKAA